MPMRTDCKNYESRTYPGGETVRKCNLDLAPEAPWRCPTECKGFERRLADVDWTYGSAVAPPTPDEPPDLTHAARVLDEAEDIINAAGPEILAEIASSEGNPRWWQRWRRRRSS